MVSAAVLDSPRTTHYLPGHLPISKQPLRLGLATFAAQIYRKQHEGKNAEKR